MAAKEFEPKTCPTLTIEISKGPELGAHPSSNACPRVVIACPGASVQKLSMMLRVLLQRALITLVGMLHSVTWVILSEISCISNLSIAHMYTTPSNNPGKLD